MKFFGFVIFVAVLWVGLKQGGFLHGLQEQPNLHSDGFLEVRATYQQGSSEFEIVMIEERPLLDRCHDRELVQDLVQACPKDMECTLDRFECKAEVAERYRKLLDKQPTHLYYSHVRMQDSDVPRSAAMVVWGLTVEQSEHFCRSFLIGSEWGKLPNAKLSCVANRRS